MNMEELLCKLDEYKELLTVMTKRVEELEIDNKFLTSELINEEKERQQIEYQYLKLRGDI